VMAAARSRDPELVRGVITAQRAFLLHELRNLETLRRRPDVDLVAALLVTAASQHVNADLAFLELAEEKLLADGGAALATLTSPAGPRPSDADATGEPAAS